MGRDARLAGNSSVPGLSGNPCSWQPGAPYNTTFLLAWLGGRCSTSLHPRLHIPIPLPPWGCSLPQPLWSSCLRGTCPTDPHPWGIAPPPPRSKPAPGTPFLFVLNGLSH